MVIRSKTYGRIVSVLPLPLFRPVVPPLALLDRALRRRWWLEVEHEADLRPSPVETSGEEAQPIEDGVGDLLRRRYEISLAGSTGDPVEVLDRFRQDPDRFAPVDYTQFASGRLAPGSQFTIDLAGPWDGPVEVVADEPDRIRLATLEDHMEAGWIEFSVIGGDDPVFRIESHARAGDRVFWFFHDVLPIARWVQTDMWAHVLETLALDSGIEPIPRVDVQTLRDQPDGERSGP